MIGNNHIQVVMNILKIINESKKKKGKKFYSIARLMNIESKLIKIGNYINSIENKIINNRFSNWLKEFFNSGFDYPLYMFTDQAKNEVGESVSLYVYTLHDGTIENKDDPDFGKHYTDISVTEYIKYAMDFKNCGYFEKKKLLKKANIILKNNGQEYEVRWKRVLNIEAQLDSEFSVIPSEPEIQA